MSETVGGNRTKKLKSGREVVLRPYPLWGLDGLLKSIMRANLEVIKEMSDNKIDGYTTAATICALMGDPTRWAVMGTPHTLKWLVGPCIEGVTLDAKGEPDIGEWAAADITELLPVVLDMVDFNVIGDRLKNSLLPAVRRVHSAFGTGGKTTTEEDGAPSSSDSLSDTTESDETQPSISPAK